MELITQDDMHLDIEAFNQFMMALVDKIQSTYVPEIDVYEPAEYIDEKYNPRIHASQQIPVREFNHQYSNVETKDGLSLPIANCTILTPIKMDVTVYDPVKDVNVIIQGESASGFTSDIGPFAYILHSDTPEEVEITLTFSFDHEVIANTLFIDTNVDYRIEHPDTYDKDRFYPVTANEFAVTFSLHHYIYDRDYIYPLFIRQLAWALITYAVDGEVISLPYTMYDGENNEAPLERVTVAGDNILPDATAVDLYASSDGATWHELPYMINQTTSEPVSPIVANQTVLTIEDDSNNEIVYDGIFKSTDNLISEVIDDTYYWTSAHKAIFDSVVLYRAIDCWHSLELTENGGQYEQGIVFNEGQYGRSKGLHFTYLYTDVPVSRLLIVPPGGKVYFKSSLDDVYTERRTTYYQQYYTVTQLDLETGENALSIVMPAAGNWRTTHNDHLNVQYLHRYVDGQVERFIPIPIHHFPEVMSAFPRMRLVDGYYDDPVLYMTQFSLSQEVTGAGDWHHMLRLFTHELYPKLRPEHEVLWMRYKYIDEETFDSTVYVKARLSTHNRFVTPIVRNLKVINSYW